MKGLYVGGDSSLSSTLKVGEWYEYDINVNNPYCYNLYDSSGYYRIVLKKSIKTLDQVRDERLNELGI